MGLLDDLAGVLLNAWMWTLGILGNFYTMYR